MLYRLIQILAHPTLDHLLLATSALRPTLHVVCNLISRHPTALLRLASLTQVPSAPLHQAKQISIWKYGGISTMTRAEMSHQARPKAAMRTAKAARILKRVSNKTASSISAIHAAKIALACDITIPRIHPPVQQQPSLRKISDTICAVYVSRRQDSQLQPPPRTTPSSRTIGTEA